MNRGRLIFTCIHPRIPLWSGQVHLFVPQGYLLMEENHANNRPLNRIFPSYEIWTTSLAYFWIFLIIWQHHPLVPIWLRKRIHQAIHFMFASLFGCRKTYLLVTPKIKNISDFVIPTRRTNKHTQDFRPARTSITFISKGPWIPENSVKQWSAWYSSRESRIID